MSQAISTAFLDADQTVVDTKFIEAGRPLPAGCIEVLSKDGRRYACSLRPSAVAFLDELRKRGWRICILTSGSGEFHPLVMEALSIAHYFDAYYGWGQMIPVDGAFVLVDDLDSRTNGIRDKFTQLGFSEFTLGRDEFLRRVEERLIVCTAYWRGKEPEPLTAVLPEMDRKMAAQGEAT